MIKNSGTVASKSTLRPTLIVVFLIGTFLSYPWELAQAPLYVGGDNFSRMLWHCFLASLSDGLLMVTIYIVGLFVFDNSKWFEKLGITGYVFIFLLGFSISTVFEWWATSNNLWEYSQKMPIIPILNIGINIPLYVFVIPPVVFRLAAAWLKNHNSIKD